MYFGHKYIETGLNFSYELATFLKYYMVVNMDFGESSEKKRVLW